MPRTPKPIDGDGPRERVNLAMSRATKERLAKLQARTDADSMAEVVRFSLAIYDHLVALHEQGCRLEVFDGEGKRVGPLVLLPTLPP